MNDQDVRDMLAERARSIQPSTGGLQRIEAKLAAAPVRAARRFPMPAVAAAVVAVAMIGAVVVAQRDDTTNVDSGPLASPTTEAEADLPLGVWPWPGDAVDESVLDAPVQTARAYVATRVLDPGVTTDSAFQQGDASSGEVVFSGQVSTTVFVRQVDGVWHVVGSASDLVTLHDAGDGTTTARVETGGTLTRTTEISSGAEASGASVEVVGGEEYPGLGYDLGRDDVVKREIFVLDTVDGTIGLTEVGFRPPGTGTGATEVLGVWPWPQDSMGGDLTDPVETARAYIESRIGISDRTTVSDLETRDGISGEVVFGGDIDATVLVRRVDGLWHVEAASSDLITLHDDDGDGELAARIEADGWLMSFVQVSAGASEPLEPAGQVQAGDEITDGLQVVDGVKAVRFLLTTGEEGLKAFAEVQIRPPFRESEIPENAVWNGGGLDARELAIAYLDDRLDDREVVVNDDFTMVGDDAGEVTWEAGVILLQRLDGYWYVVEAIGDSVQIEGYSRDVDFIDGTIVVAEPGVLHLSAGDTSWEIVVDDAGEGTRVPFSHEIDDDTSDSLRVVFETDAGFVSLAEQSLR